MDSTTHELKYNEIIRALQSYDSHQKENFLPIRVAFLGNITMDPIITYFRFFCYSENMRADIYIGDYDNILQEIFNSESSLYQHNPEAIVICLGKDVLVERLVNSFSAMTREEVNSEVERVLNHFSMIVDNIRKNTSALLLLHNFEVPVYPSLGVFDYQKRDSQLNTFREINMRLADLASRHEGIYVVDMDMLQSILGYPSFIDKRYWHLGRMPYTRAASKKISLEYLKFLRALKGKNKKCLVLDCDNTLWGGIIGEDGISKIQIGHTYPGSAFRDFQKAVKNLYHRGIMLALCSKNNEQDVMEVLETHPDMVLRQEHFVSMRINWNDKVSNLQEIAAELNIGLDSIVYMDDSAFEVNMVKQLLPEVEAILLPEDPANYKDLLNSSGMFDALTFSEEDRTRSAMYRAEVSRKKAAKQLAFKNVEDFYRYLEMEVVIKFPDEFSIPRISQLTQRTNQFNLTSRRYSESDISPLINANDADVCFLKLRDRFGDSGIVGTAILTYNGKDCYIDTFLLSCRVIGRGVEDVLLQECERLARNRGCIKLVGTYIPTKKNSQVKYFYRDRGFVFVGEYGNESRYALSLPDQELNVKKLYFKSVVSDISEGVVKVA